MNIPDRSPKVQKFLNCEFEYECPRDWFELELTNKAGIKHCKECQKDVHLCINQEELDYAITQKHCIAYFQDPSLTTRFKLSREKCEANKTDANYERNVVLGMPTSEAKDSIPRSYKLNSDTLDK